MGDPLGHFVDNLLRIDFILPVQRKLNHEFTLAREVRAIIKF